MKHPRSLYPLLTVFAEAVDYTKFWNELRETLSLVNTGGKLSGGIHHKEGVKFTFHRAAQRIGTVKSGSEHQAV